MPKVRLDHGQAATDDGVQLVIMRGDFQRRVDQQAAAPLGIAQRALNDLRVFRGPRCLQPLDARPGGTDRSGAPKRR
jgi:hypothetical protein